MMEILFSRLKRSNRESDYLSNMRKLQVFLPFLVLALLPIPLFAQGKIMAAEAKKHIGETATVCGTVASTQYAARGKGNPTFLNFDEAYPKQIFTKLIWGSDRPKFGDPETKYANKKVCATGLNKDYKGVPEVVAEQPSQIEIQK